MYRNILRGHQGVEAVRRRGLIASGVLGLSGLLLACTPNPEALRDSGAGPLRQGEVRQGEVRQGDASAGPGSSRQGSVAARESGRGSSGSSALTQPRRGSGGAYKVGRPYQISGVWYYPQEDFDYDQTGIASWYGDAFHGKPTANGERYDKRALTAAHPTLPMPTIVRVTNLENGRAVDLRINDRGPFKRGRIIDVSERAAELLDFKNDGTARVRVTVRREQSLALARELKGEGGGTQVASAGGGQGAGQVNSQPVVHRTSPEATSLFVQAGAFTQRENVDQARTRLSDLGDVRVQRARVDGRRFYRVRVGPLGDIQEADRVLARVVDAGYPEARVVLD